MTHALKSFPGRRTYLLAFAVPLLSIAALSTAADPRSISPSADPAPPSAGVLPKEGSASATATAKAETTFHAAPKPMNAGAKVEDSTSFLGPTHDNTSRETNLAKEFGKSGPPMVWEIKKGEGYSAPAVLADRVVLFHRVEDEEVIDCLNAENGKRFWRFAYPTAYNDRYGYCSGPRASPVIATRGGHDFVFTFGAEGKLHCLELSTGRVLWKRDIVTEFKLKQNFFGVGSTPLVEGDKLIVNVGADKGPCVAAFDIATGKMVWGAGDRWGPSYASPVPATVFGKRRVFVFAGGESNPPSGGLLCIDPANGEVDFTFPWRGRRRESVNASTPLIIDANSKTPEVLISESYGSGSALLALQDEGKKVGFKKLWENKSFGTHFMTAVEKDGYLYGVDGHGPQDAFLVCVDRHTGEETWRTQPEWVETVAARAGGERKLTVGTYRAWLTPVDGGSRYLMLGEYGHLLWVELTPKGYKQLCRGWLFSGDQTWTPPVISRGLLYVCQNSAGMLQEGSPRLICYDLRQALGE